MQNYLVHLENYYINPLMVVAIFKERNQNNGCMISCVDATEQSSYFLKETTCEEAANKLGFTIVERVPVIRDFTLPAQSQQH